MKKLVCISRKEERRFLEVLDKISNGVGKENCEEVIKEIVDDNEENGIRCCFIFSSFDQLKEKIEKVKNTEENKIVEDGIFYSQCQDKGKVAFLFPGQGSQKVRMFSTLKEKFIQMKESLKLADETLKEKIGKNLSEFIYPEETEDEEKKKKQMEQLTRTDITQPALGVVEMGLFKIFSSFGITPDMAAGHSLGEYVALSASGIIEEKVLYPLLQARGKAIIEAGGEEGKMMAVGCGEEEVKELIKGYDVYISNLNSPSQTIVSGKLEELERLKTDLRNKKIRAKIINVSCAFHSPFMAAAKEIFDEELKKVDFKNGLFPVYSNLTGEKYPEKEEEIREILSNHLINGVRFIDEVENMFRDGAKLFVEIGPGKVLTGLVNSILSGKDFLAIAVDGKDEIESFLYSLAICFLFNRKVEPSFVGL